MGMCVYTHPLYVCTYACVRTCAVCVCVFTENSGGVH